jgi:hypothetical protein
MDEDSFPRAKVRRHTVAFGSRQHGKLLGARELKFSTCSPLVRNKRHRPRRHPSPTGDSVSSATKLLLSSASRCMGTVWRE